MSVDPSVVDAEPYGSAPGLSGNDYSVVTVGAPGAASIECNWSGPSVDCLDDWLTWPYRETVVVTVGGESDAVEVWVCVSADTAYVEASSFVV